MTGPAIAARLVACIVALALLIASAHVTITKAGGYADPTSWLIMATTAGIGVGAIVIGFAARERRYALAFVLVVALLCGEGFAFLLSGERIIASREALQTPSRQAQEKHEAAKTRVERAETDLKDAKAAVTDKADAMGCKVNCKELLQSAVTSAERELTNARAALDLAPPPASGTALADRLGVSPTALDLLIAALGGFAVNGLAACLLAFVAHHGNPVKAPSKQPEAHSKAPEAPSKAMERPRKPQVGSVSRFLKERLEPADHGRFDVADALKQYREWCIGNGCSAISAADFADQLGTICAELSIPIKEDKSGLYCEGVKLKA